MEATYFSDTSVDFQQTYRPYIPEDTAVITIAVKTSNPNSKLLLEDKGKPRNPASRSSRWLVAGPDGCTLTSSQQPGKQDNIFL
jgi:hypothetical protein